VIDPTPLPIGLEPVVHPSAIVDSTARLGSGVRIGPWSIIGPDVDIGEGTHVASNVLIERDSVIGEECRIHHGAVLGSDPQDLKYEGEYSTLRVGDRTTVREYATVNRGTAASGETVVGSDCLLMAYSHVAHDCRLGDHVVLANSANMAGHVVLEDWVIVGGLTPLHQFVHVGTHAFIGGGSRIPQDVPPYCRAAGNPGKLYGLNTVGLERRAFDPEVRKALKKAYRLVFASKLNVSQGLARAEVEVEQLAEVRRFLDFIRGSERGIIQG